MSLDLTNSCKFVQSGFANLGPSLAPTDSAIREQLRINFLRSLASQSLSSVHWQFYEKPASHTHTSAADDIPVTRRTSVLIADSIIDIRRLPVSSRGLPLEATGQHNSGSGSAASQIQIQIQGIPYRAYEHSQKSRRIRVPGARPVCSHTRRGWRPASIFPFLSVLTLFPTPINTVHL